MQVTSLKEICDLEGVECAVVYNHLLHLHTLEWSVQQAMNAKSSMEG